MRVSEETSLLNGDLNFGFPGLTVQSLPHNSNPILKSLKYFKNEIET